MHAMMSTHWVEMQVGLMIDNIRQFWLSPSVFHSMACLRIVLIPGVIRPCPRFVISLLLTDNQSFDN